MSSNNDNVLLITAGYDRTIRFWQANTAVIYRTIMHEDSVRNKNEFLNRRICRILFFSQQIVWQYIHRKLY
jgi:hypothetical protein